MKVKKSFLLIFLIFYITSIFTISMPNFISNFWHKLESEVFTKELNINSKTNIEIYNIKGNITIKTWNQNKICIQANKIAPKDYIKDIKIEVTNKLNNCKIVSKLPENHDIVIDYIIIVPQKANVTILSNTSNVKAENLHGTLNINIKNGNIESYNNTKSVIAKTERGTIKIKQTRFLSPSVIFLETNNGSIYLQLPKKINANLQANIYQGGFINSEIPITLYPLTMKINIKTLRQLRKDIKGTLGTGGSPIVIKTVRGNIDIKHY